MPTLALLYMYRFILFWSIFFIYLHIYNIYIYMKGRPPYSILCSKKKARHRLCFCQPLSYLPTSPKHTYATISFPYKKNVYANVTNHAHRCLHLSFRAWVMVGAVEVGARFYFARAMACARKVKKISLSSVRRIARNGVNGI